MPLIQGGPPEWIWERTSDPLMCEVVPSQALEGHTVYELKVTCGLEIMRLQFFTKDEIKEVQAMLRPELPKGTKDVPAAEEQEPRPTPEPRISSEWEAGNTPKVPEAERPAERRESVVSDPDRPTPH